MAEDPLAARLLADKALLATATTQRMKEADPDLFARYPADGETRCIEDTGFHVEHLAAAVDVQEPKVFSDYVDWLTGMLNARGIPTDDIVANFECLAALLQERYGSDAEPAVSLLDASCEPLSST